MESPESLRTPVRSYRARVVPRWGRLAFAALILTVIASSPIEAQSRQEVRQFRQIGDRTDDDPDAARVRRTREGTEDVAPAIEGLEVGPGDVLTVRFPWIMRVRLNVSPNRAALVAIAQDARGEDGRVVEGMAAGTEGARLALYRNPLGGSLVHILNGAMFLEGWPSDRHFCLSAAGACAANQGTSYALSVDGTGRARLAVTSDTVHIRWWGMGGALRGDAAGELDQDSLGAAAVALNLDSTPDELRAASVTVDTATVGEIWTWTKTERPRRENAPNPTALDLAVKFNADDIWGGDKKKWLLLIPPVAVAACFIFDIWVCGGDATGNVIVNP